MMPLSLDTHVSYDCQLSYHLSMYSTNTSYYKNYARLILFYRNLIFRFSYFRYILLYRFSSTPNTYFNISTMYLLRTYYITQGKKNFFILKAFVRGVDLFQQTTRGLHIMCEPLSLRCSVSNMPNADVHAHSLLKWN